jgi:DNA repair exonuclease SbcCD ATPase subunit
MVMKIGAIRNMKITKIKLKGYIGIYNGLGLNELEIDLSESKHKIVVISGKNGCGKSTLLNAMSILPDNSSDFVAGMNAEKCLRLIDGINIYDIRITSAAGKGTSRGVSKASIVKNGIELNPNGNIGSYKEIIFQEFELDSNFIALSRLSGDDRGLADKSPAERKKFMSYIVESLDTYNSIYKNLNKKASIFKSYVSNLHTKIQNVGDEANLRSTLLALESRKKQLDSSIENIKNAIVESQTILSLNDPNGMMQIKYQETETKVKQLDAKVNMDYKLFSKLCDTLNIESKIEVVDAFLQERTSLIEAHEHNLEESNMSKVNLVNRRESLIADINTKQLKISELSKGVNPTLVSTIESLKEKIAMEESVLKQIGVIDPDNTSREELQLIFETIQTIINLVLDNLYVNMTDSLMSSVLSFSKGDLAKLEKDIKKQGEKVTQLYNESKDIERDAEIISLLNNRPKGCKIDDCYFISSAYKLQNEKYSGMSIDKVLKKSAMELTNAVNTQNQMAEAYENMIVASQKRDILDHILELIEMNKAILQKCVIGSNLVQTFSSRIASLNSFNEFKDLDEIIGKINTISIYKEDVVSLKALETSRLAQSNAEARIAELTEEVVTLQDTLNGVVKEITSTTNEIVKYSQLLTTLRNESQTAANAKEKGEVWANDSAQLQEARNQFNDIVSKSKESIAILGKISSMNGELQQLQTQVQPLEAQISRINGQLVMLESYKQEYQMYSDKYTMVDTLKKYSSPTGGIQTLFMSIYMSKTLELANQVLSMVFGNQYTILDYVINSNEFRIPFIGSGMMVDDISNGSTSQVCMMGLAMNLVLLYQASTRYNITRLDEIDGGLDNRNKLEFVSALYRIIDILNIDQLFIISHSLELETSNVDMIKLIMYDDFDVPEGNVLYDFQKSTLV